MKSNLLSLSAGFESEEDAAGETLAKRVCKSPGDAVQAIATGDAVDAAANEFILTDPTIDSPAVGEPL